MIAYRSEQDRSLGPNDLGANIVAVQALCIRLDVADRSLVEPEIDGTGNDIVVLRKLGANSDGGERMHFGDFVIHKPARGVEVVDRVGIEEHSIDPGLIGCNGRHVLVSADRLENDWFTNFALEDLSL